MPHKKNLTTTSLAVSVQIVERKIYLIRGHKVMIDVDQKTYRTAVSGSQSNWI